MDRKLSHQLLLNTHELRDEAKVRVYKGRYKEIGFALKKIIILVFLQDKDMSLDVRW